MLADITRILASHQISIEAIIQKEPQEGETSLPIIMLTQKTLEKEMLPNLVELKVDDSKLNFAIAKDMSDKKVNELIKNPMLISWYDGNSRRFAPNVTCCSDEKPGWVVYAESRGGSLSISINNEQFVFIYADLM